MLALIVGCLLTITKPTTLLKKVSITSISPLKPSADMVKQVTLNYHKHWETLLSRKKIGYDILLGCSLFKVLFKWQALCISRSIKASKSAPLCWQKTVKSKRTPTSAWNMIIQY